MKISILVISLFSLVSCKLSLESLLGIHEWKTYIIPEGGDYSEGLHINTMDSDHLDFMARFDETAIYDLKSNDQNDINKLYGFTDCNSTVHENSARFGWRWSLTKQKIEIFAYVYGNGQVHYVKIGEAIIGKEQSYSIYCVGDHYNFNFNGNLIQMPRGCGQQIAVRTIEYPYFGGSQKAPHTIQIAIKQL